MKTTKNETVVSYKCDVDRMADYLEAAGYNIKRTHLIEASARLCGFRDWRTLRHDLTTKPVTAKAAVPDMMGKSVRVYMNVRACHEYGDSPHFCFADIDQSWVNRIYEMQAACKALKISEMEDDCMAFDWIDDGNVFRIQHSCLKISLESFWFHGSPKHCDYNVETQLFNINHVIELVQECKRTELFLFNDKGYVELLMTELGRDEDDPDFVDCEEEDCAALG